MNIGAERAAIEEKDQREEEERAALRLEDFRAAVENPDFTGVKRLIIDPESHVIRPSSGADSKIKGKNETIIAALKGALQLEFPIFSSAFVDKIVEKELPHSSTWSMFETLQGKPALSTETLQLILASADNNMAERAFVEEENSFTLQHFRNALAHPDNKKAERLIIRGQGASAMIVAQTGSSHVEDAIIRKTLKRALEREGHRRDFVHQLTSEELPYLSMFAKARKIRAPLNFEILKTIIQKTDDAMAEIKLFQATRSIVPLSATAANRAAARTLLRSSIEQFFNRLGIQNDTIAAGVSVAVLPKSAEEIAVEHAAAAEQEAWEQSACEKIIRSLIHHGKNVDALKEHYREAEAAAIAAETFHNQTMEARWDAEKKEKYLTQARLFFEKVKAALDERRNLAEFDESILNEISQGADLAGAFLAMFNVPFVSLKGIADAVSTFATFADHRLTIAEAQKAFNALKFAIQKAEVATEGHERVDEVASAMHAHAEEVEKLKNQEDHDETMRLSNLVRLPSDADDAALRQWATELACESDTADENQATITAHLLYKQGKKNPAQIHDFISTTWNERLLLSQQLLQQLEEETFLEAYKSAQKKEIEAEADAVSARSRFEEAAQAKSEWFTKRDQLRLEKKNLEDQLRSDATDREQRQSELDAKRRELSIHQTQKETIDATYQATAEEVKKLTTAATAAHADAFEKFKTYDSTKKFQMRNSTRFQAAADADRKVLEDILIAKACSKEAQAREAKIREAKAGEAAALAQQTEALTRGDKKIAELYSQIAETLGGNIWDDSGATFAYEWALKEEGKGNREAAETWLKCAQVYEEQAAALTQQIAALTRGNNEVIELHKQRSNALKGAAVNYSKTAEAQSKSNREAAKNYRKEAQAFEAEAAALAQQTEALVRDDKGAAKFHMLRVKAWEKVLSAYAWANVEQAKGNREATATWHKKAQAREAEAAALIQEFKATEEESKSTTSSTEEKKSEDSIPQKTTPGKKGKGNCTIS
ncbi:MAG: hypothetical protein K2W97_00320 [Chthoniobacterales bacterium]|nr:hypothetical protein [Chthoniobacterales bacterium]